MATTVVRSKSVRIQVIVVEAVGAAAILVQAISSPSSTSSIEWQARALALIMAIPFFRLTFGGAFVGKGRVRVRNAFRTRTCQVSEVEGVEWAPDAILRRDVAALHLRDGRLFRISLISPSKVQGREGMEQVLDELRKALTAGSIDRG